jgi:CBS domain containing-hemolysin-like protein
VLLQQCSFEDTAPPWASTAERISLSAGIEALVPGARIPFPTTTDGCHAMSDTLLTLTYVILLLAANGFFVAAEFALVKVRPVRLQKLADGGSRAAAQALKVLANLEIYLAACQLGITMASLGLGWIGEPFVAALLRPVFLAMELSPELLHSISFALGFLIFSSLHIIVGEQVPKTLAIREAEVTSRFVVWPLVGFFWLAWPLTVSLNWANRHLLALLGVKEAGHGDAHTGDELRSLIAVASEHGLVKSQKAEMLDRMFEFDVRNVADVMTPRRELATLDVARSAEANKAVLLATQHSRYPLLNSHDDAVLGVIVVKDFYNDLLQGGETPWSRLEDFRREAIFVPETARVDRLMERMRRQHAHTAMVVDEYGGFTGMVTLEDLVEEIVGEIEDEFDDEEPMIRQVDNSWEVDGILPLYEVVNETGMEFSGAGGVNTLSGLIMKRLGRVPKPGDRITVDDATLEVVDMKGTRVGTVRITSGVR